MPNEDTMTIHETAPDGTETTIEITSTKPDDAVDGDDKTLVEEVYEALFDDDLDDDDTDEDTTETETGDDAGLAASDETLEASDETETDAVDLAADDPANQLTPTEEEISTNSVEFTLGEDAFPQADDPTLSSTIDGDIADTGYSAAAGDPTSSAETEADTSAADAEAAEQQAHADAAKDAQGAADEFVAQGDYAAAAEARETAENESYAAGDGSMLGASDAGDLENAAWEQQNADYYRDQQAQDIAAGDYEAAKEDAQNVGAHTGDADYLAGGDDHTGQADKDVANLDWSVWNEKNADSALENADYYAAQGDFDHADSLADQAEGYQATADGYADHADPTSVAYDYDAASAVDAGGSYDAGYDAMAIDSGLDAGVDTSAAASYDPGTDDV